MKTFPTLYGRNSKGQIKVWSVYAVDDVFGVRIATRHGLQGGKIQEATVQVREGKNLGRANETTPYEQACLEAEAKWKRQQDRGYSPTVAGLSGKPKVPRAMLAHPHKKYAHRMPWPAAIQPKMDGIRLLAVVGHVDVQFWSRNGKAITTVDHLEGDLIRAFEPGTVVDGELYHPDMTLQEIVSGAKKQSDLSGRLQYWIYDLVSDVQFADRHRAIHAAVKPFDPQTMALVRVPTRTVSDEESMRAHHAQHVQLGFEGTIVRNLGGAYKAGYRSADLLKVKDFMDMEFEIVGYKDGKGKEEGLVTWRCVTGDGKKFDARPRGTDSERRAIFEVAEELVGKMLTVRFMNFTPDGIPFHPVGLAVRDYE